ncbi:hypothetical protein [uncultured phage cr105_1]|uniref:BACON domain-containing protein n=1 Tax=uncultured phage cr105_1 TaxID=2986415 RepID=A0AAE7S2Z4_9CAUD|nr:hypothetical protein [uncultured phage cr105_1]
MINNIYIGTTKADTYYYGSDQVDRIYSGDILVYQKEDEYVFTTDTPSLNFGSTDFDAQVPLIESLKNGLDQPYDFAIASHTWITVEMLYSPPDEVTGLISTTAEITVAANTSSNFRIGQVTFMQRESGQTLTITISQEGNTVTTTFYPTNLNFEQKGGAKYCTYTPENAFAQYTPQGNYTWLTTTMANGTMTIKATTNLKTSARTATYDIVVGSDKYTLYITQDKYIMS